MDLVNDLTRVITSHEFDFPRQHRWDKCSHCLPKHVAKRKKIEKPNRRERSLVTAVLQNLTFDRNNVGENISMLEYDALRLCSSAGSKQNLRDRIATDGGDLRLTIRTTPVNRRKRPDDDVHIGRLYGLIT